MNVRLLAAAVIAGAVPLVAGSPGPTFVEAATESGLTFVHDNGARGEFMLPEIMGSGVALLDYDSDGDLDVFLVQGAPLTEAGDTDGSRLFRNDVTVVDGQALPRFTDVTGAAGIAVGGVGMGVATGDYDGDGDVDLYVTRFGSNVLLRNDGAVFTDVTQMAGVDDPRWSTSAAFFDADRDGDLDLFVANYLDFTVAANKRCVDPVGERDYCAPSSYRPVPDRFFRNRGDGTFEDATDAAGFSRAYGAGLGVAVGDYNGDGWPDVYVANDATPNQLWINQQDGTFVDDGPLAGVALNAAGRPEGSMGIASGDYDGDGDEDLVVSNLVRETFVAYVNDGTGAFEDRRAEVGIAAPTADRTGFGIEWLDADNDGLLDLIATNGAVNIVASQRGSAVPYRQLDQLFHNEGNGRLREISTRAGAAFRNPDVGRGLVVGDIDNDGDLDAVVSNNGAPARLLLNQGPGGHFVRVRLSAPAPNRLGIGARVGLRRSGEPTAWRRVRTDGSYLSAKEPVAHFGLGPATAVEAVVVEWPDGVREEFTDVQIDRTNTLEYGRGAR